jgi:hypothetical protein
LGGYWEGVNAIYYISKDLTSVLRVRVHVGAVDHPRAVHEHDVVHLQIVAHLEIDMVNEPWAELAEPSEAEVRVADEGGAVSVLLRGGG